VGSARWRRKRVRLLGSVTRAMSFMRPEQLGQTWTSMANVRLSSSAQGRYRERWVGRRGLAACWLWGDGSAGGAGWGQAADRGGGQLSERGLTLGQAVVEQGELGAGLEHPLPLEQTEQAHSDHL